MAVLIHFVEACVITALSSSRDMLFDSRDNSLNPHKKVSLCCGDEHLLVDDDPSDQCCSWT